MAKERFELSDSVEDLLSGMGKLSAEMKDNSAKAMEYAQSMNKLAKQNTELTKLNEALSTSFSKVSNALNKASNGNDLTKYIKSQEDMVKSINRTYRQYSMQSDTIKKNHLAEELYKQVNALRAATDNVDLSNLIGNFEEVKKAISSVGSYVKSEFSVSAFKEIKETIEVLEQAGLKIKNVFSTLDKGSKFYDIDRELRETKEQLDLINNTDISELTGKLKKLGEIAEEEFNTFLNLYNLSGSSYKFYDIFEEIRSGAITSQQAIERVKNEFEYLLVEAKSSGNQNYDVLNSSAIREMVENISTLRIKVDEIMTRVSNVHGDTTGIKIFDEEQFSRLLILFEKIESSLSSMKAVFVDVGDGEEFSPLLKMINNVQESVNKLSSSVKGIGLNMNIDVGSDSEMEAKVQSKISNALQAYQRLFDHIKMSGAGGSMINTNFFEFDINQYDTMMAKLQAYKKFIENMRNEAKAQFNGKDVLFQGTDKSYWISASAAMGQVTKAFKEMNTSADTSPLENLFGGKTDLTEVVTQLNLIVDKLGEISTTASEFKNVFANGFNVSASVEEIEKLTSRVKELETELSKVKVGSTTAPIKDTFQGDKIKETVNSVRELDRTLEGVKIPKENFDNTLSQLDLTKSKLKEIVRITQDWNNGVERFTLKDKFGSTETYEIDSNTKKGQFSNSHYVKYDAKQAEKLQKDFNKAYEEATKINNALTETKGKLDGLSKHPELSSQFSEVENTIKSLNTQLTQGEISVSEYNKAVKETTSNYSKLVSIQQKRDTETYNANAKQARDEAKALEQVVKQAQKLAEEKRKARQADKQATQSSVDKALKDQLDAWEAIQKIRLQIAQTDDKDTTKLQNLKTQKKKSQEDFLNAQKVLKANEDLYDKESQLAKLELERLETNEKINKLKLNNVDVSSVISKGDSDLKKFETRKHQSEEYRGAIENLRQSIEKLRALEEKTVSSQLLPKNEVDNINDAIASVEKYTNEIKNMSAVERGSDAGTRTKWANRIQEYLDKNTRLTREFREELEGLIRTLRTGGDSVNIKNIIGQFEDAKFRIKEAKLEGISFFDIFKNKAVYGFAARLAQYYLSFYDFIRYARYAVNALVELDSALLDLKKTTTMTGSQLNDFYYASNDVAKQMGVTTAQIIEQASAWSRLGYSSQEAATKMAQLSSQFASISPGMETDQAQEGLVSIMKANIYCLYVQRCA